MNRTAHRAAALLAAVCCWLGAMAHSPELDGTMMPYTFTREAVQAPWDTTMRPVFVNYVARHGARYLSSESKVSNLRSELADAEKKGLLTKKGHDFLLLLNKVDYRTAGHWGALDPLGIQEENKLAQEMYDLMPGLLSSGGVYSCATYVPRVIKSQYEFCHRLAVNAPRLEIQTHEGKQFNPLLRFFTTDKAYADYLKEGPWRYAFDTFRSEKLPVIPAAGMLQGVYDSKRLQDISEQAYGVLQSLRAAGIEAEPSEWFSEKEYRDCWEVANLKHYLQRSANTFTPIAAEAARPLLDSLVSNADRAFEGNVPYRRADLYFGHAETVIPLFALMRLPGCYSPDLQPDQVAAVWRDWEVAPLGANLMMVCLTDGNGGRYVSLRLNGRWLEMEGTKVIPWERLRTLWTS